MNIYTSVLEGQFPYSRNYKEKVVLKCYICVTTLSVSLSNGLKEHLEDVGGRCELPGQSAIHALYYKFPVISHSPCTVNHYFIECVNAVTIPMPVLLYRDILIPLLTDAVG